MCSSDLTTTTGIGTTQPVEGDIKIFPNPATNVVNVSFDGMSVKEISVLDMSGRQVVAIPVSNTSTYAIPVGELTSGIYILRLNTSAGILVRKFTVSR